MSDNNTDGPVVSVEDKDPAGATDESNPIIAKVTVKNPAYPDGTELEIPGLGIVVNGATKSVSYIQVVNYEIATGQKWPMKGTKPQELVLDFKTKEVSE